MIDTVSEIGFPCNKLLLLFISFQVSSIALNKEAEVLNFHRTDQKF